MFKRVLESGEIRFDVTEDGLILSVQPDRILVCPDCPDIHVIVLPSEYGTREDVVKLSAGISHLAGHMKK